MQEERIEQNMSLKGEALDFQERQTEAAQGVIVTQEQIKQYLEQQRRTGLAEESLKGYRRNLMLLYTALPEDKCLQKGTLRQWRDRMLEQGVAPRTINTRISVANNFLAYLDRREFQLPRQLTAEEPVHPEMSRNEYLRLLQTARLLGQQRTYLLIKLFVTTGLYIQELPKVTVEAVGQGGVTLSSKSAARWIPFPVCLRKELLDYAEKNGIRSGAIFITRTGKCIGRSTANCQIRRICHDARVPQQKGNPRCLRRLYQSTLTELKANVIMLMEQAYDQLLETEQVAIGWIE